MTEESTARDSIFLSSYSCVSVDDIDFSLIRISSAITKVQPACAKNMVTFTTTPHGNVDISDKELERTAVGKSSADYQ